MNATEYTQFDKFSQWIKSGKPRRDGQPFFVTVQAEARTATQQQPRRQPLGECMSETKRRRNLPLMTARGASVNGAKAREWIAAQAERPSSREVASRFGLAQAHCTELIARKFGRARIRGNVEEARQWLKTQDLRPTKETVMKRFKVGSGTVVKLLTERYGDAFNNTSARRQEAEKYAATLTERPYARELVERFGISNETAKRVLRERFGEGQRGKKAVAK